MPTTEKPPVRGTVIEPEHAEGIAKPAAGGVVGRLRDVDRDTPLKDRKDKNGRLRK